MKKINRYMEIEEKARGGMAIVYRANDPNHQRKVAIKVIMSSFQNTKAVERFKREVKILVSLQHPAIVPIYDYGEENGEPYLVMALMEGGTLADYLQKYGAPNEAARLLERLAPALDMIHQKNIVHRDLKPSNILFDQQNNPYIADFGIAKLLTEVTRELSRTGQVIGSPSYMSPEQARGDKDIDGRSDIYSLGVILFKLLTGQNPFTGQMHALIDQHINKPVPDISTIKPELPPCCKMVIEKAMAKKPADRYATVCEMAKTFSVTLKEAEETLIVHPQDPQYPLPSSFIKFFVTDLK